jgi:hypothetical protein
MDGVDMVDRYIPIGFVHTTSTAENNKDEPSLHLTVNLETHLHGTDIVRAARGQCAADNTYNAMHD